MSQNHLLSPSLEQLMDCHTDITAPGQPVEVITDERGVLWVNVGPTCVLRICRMTDLRIDVQGDTPTEISRTFNQPKLPTRGSPT